MIYPVLFAVVLSTPPPLPACTFTSTFVPFVSTPANPTFFREGFESKPPLAPCINNIFFDSGSVCAVPPTDKVDRLTTLIVGLCTVGPRTGTFFANSTGGIATVYFQGRPAEQFGGFFSTTVASTVTLNFYDSSNVLLGTTSGPTNCGWVWLGGDVNAPTCMIDHVEISETFGGAVQMDDLQVDYYTDGPITYCTPTLTTNGCAGMLSWVSTPGITTVAPKLFTVTASGLEGGKTGLFFYGINGPNQVPFGSCLQQFLCVKTAPIWRLAPVQSTGGIPGTCTGSMSVNFDAWMLTAPAAAPGFPFASVPTSFTDYYMQAWFRDPSSCTTSGTTNAIAFRLVD